MDHPHNTRNRTAYLVPRFQRLNLSQRSLSYILPFKWNEIPLNVRMSPSLNKFKKLFEILSLRIRDTVIVKESLYVPYVTVTNQDGLLMCMSLVKRFIYCN